MRSLLALLLLSSVSLLPAADPSTAGVDPVELARRDFQAGKFDSGLAILEQAEKEAQLSGRGLAARGSIFLEQGKFDQAIQTFEAAYEKDAWAYAHLHLGDALVRQKKWEEARAFYLKSMPETDVLALNERYRFAIFMAAIGAKQEELARKAYSQILFPTETPAYYYAQAAWEFVHGRNREGQDWIKRAGEVFTEEKTAWFARFLFDFGWVKTKPSLTAD